MVPVNSFQRAASPVVRRLLLSGLVVAQTYFAFYTNQETNKDFVASAKWREQENQMPEKFDFIVVGGGSAGCVLANRLSQYNRVLLLELGGNPNPLSLLTPSPLLVFPGVTLPYQTEPQQGVALGLIDHKLKWPRGLGLGGTSVINGAMYQRGNPKDYDNWARITGDDSWSFKNVLKYFKKLEDYHGEYPNSQLHSTGGPIAVEKDRVRLLEKYWLSAAKEKGYRIKNSELEQEGFGSTEYTMRNGLRWSTYTGYIQPILNRKNLKIYRFSRVIKVHLDKNKHAYGVTFLRHGQRRFVRATKEIILSAGCIDSPKILMLSGIGPRKHLNETGIKTRANLPVGRNLQDHLMTLFGPFLLHGEDTVTISKIVREAQKSVNGLFKNPREGLLANGIVSMTSFVTTKAGNETQWPDIQYMGVGLGISPGFSEGTKLAFNIKLDVMDGYLGDYRYLEQDATWCLVGLQRPKSVGTITLSSRDPLLPPLIQPNYLTHPNDIKVIVEGIQRLVNIVETTKAFGSLKARLIENLLPGCDHLPPKSAKYYECYVRHITLTTYHPVGTAAMGKNLKDKRAVVDSKLRVLKTNGLRVIDGSVMPQIVNANTNIPIIMIGEMGSDFIRHYWGQQYAVCLWREYTFLYSDSNICFYKRFV